MTRLQTAIVGGILMFLLAMAYCALLIVTSWLFVQLAFILGEHLTSGWQLIIIAALLISFCFAFAFAAYVYKEGL